MNVYVRDKLIEAQDLLSVCMVAATSAVEGNALSKQEATGLWHILHSVTNTLQECNNFLECEQPLESIYHLKIPPKEHTKLSG